MIHNEQCPKCHLGFATNVRYMPAATETKPTDLGNTCLTTCPSEEHLHLQCAVCWFFEAKPVMS